MGKKSHSPELSRRDFVTIMTAFLGSIMGVVIGIPAIGYIISPALKAQGGKEDWIPAGKLEAYPIGTPTLFSFTRTKVNGWERTTNSYGAFILRESESKVKVFSNVCTHLSCRVNWHDDLKEFVCPCHDAHFDQDGKVLSGPPPRPMDAYEFKIEDDTIFIHLLEA